MKAKIIATGEIVNVIAVDIDDTLSVITRYIYKEIDDIREWYDHELFFDIQEEEKSIDWEQRRFELAMAAMQGFMACSLTNGTPEEIAEWSIEQADAVIAKLKEE